MTQPNNPDLASPRFKANPFGFYARLRATAPAHRVTLPGKQSAWLVTRYDDVLALLKDERVVKDPLNALSEEQRAKQPWMPAFLKPLSRNMLDLDGADHARLRALVHKAFTPRLIAQLRDRVQTLADDLLNAGEKTGQFDLIRDYALPLPITVISDLLGVPQADRRQFGQWSRRIVAVTASPLDLPVALPAIWQFMRFVRRLCAIRRADPQDDLLSALLRAREAGDSLSEDELLAMVILILIAGHETTVNLIGNGTLALLENPEQLALLRENPALSTSAVEELLRFTSPVEMATERYTRSPITIAGTTIPRGERVLAVLASANRDERQFTQPALLDLAREQNRHLAFGQGIHYCLGAPLARLEGQIAFNTLLHRAPNLRLTVPANMLRWRRGLFLRGLERLPLAL
ncbi:MAG TPA: cytochrome P450 [Thermomicrobiales bacterium]|jgi:cytochrome P450 PksS